MTTRLMGKALRSMRGVWLRQKNATKSIRWEILSSRSGLEYRDCIFWILLRMECKFKYLEAISELPFLPNLGVPDERDLSTGQNFNPQNTPCIPVVNPAKSGTPSLILDKNVCFETAFRQLCSMPALNQQLDPRYPQHPRSNEPNFPVSPWPRVPQRYIPHGW